MLESVSVLQSQVMEVGIDPVELPMLRHVLEPLLGTARFGDMALDALAYVALGGLYGASLFIARAADPPTARGEVDRVLDTLIGGLVRGISRLISRRRAQAVLRAAGTPSPGPGRRTRVGPTSSPSPATSRSMSAYSWVTIRTGSNVSMFFVSP